MPIKQTIEIVWHPMTERPPRFDKSLGSLKYFKWWLKWYERWMKLAEQFKEGE